MGSSSKWLVPILLSAALLAVAQNQNSRGTTAPDSCAIIREAIRQFGQIKGGMTRGEVEEHFKRDGGLQFRNATRYVFPSCTDATIKVEIKFKDAGTSGETPFPKDDVVVEVSKPYLEYFHAD